MVDKPLAAVGREPDTKGAAALLRLFGAFEEIEEIQKRFKAVDDEVQTLNAMAKGQYSPYIKLAKKSDRNEAAKELAEAKSEASLVHRRADLDLFEAERRAREEQQRLRAKLRPLTSKLDELRGKLAIVEATLAGQTRISTEDLEEFYIFFPEVNREQLETVEYYHRALAAILEDQLNEQHQLYLNQAATLQAAIDEQKRQIISLGESVQLDDETYKKSLALNTKINQLEEQIRTFDQNEQLKVERTALRRDLDQSVPEKLEQFANKINAEMQAINKLIYGEERRKSPIFSFKLAKNGVSYSFDHNGDGGSGAKANHLILFDLAVLHSTPLPFLIHDSAIIKTIAFDPVAELLEVYSETSHLISGANEPKQVFFSFDATLSYGEKAERRVAENQALHLDEGTEALYGFTWNTESDEEPLEGDGTP